MSDVMIEINAICEFDENRKDFLFQIIPIMEDLEGFVGKDSNLEEIGQHIGAAIDKVCVSYNKKLCQKDARIKELEEREKKLIKYVRFYADENPECSDDWEMFCSEKCKEALKRSGHHSILCKQKYGKHARQALTELGINNE